MSEILIEMAQQAGQNKVLCAGLIREYSQRQGMSWKEIARQLHLDDAGLAKLALCRSPRPTHLDQELEQIAAYLGVEKSGLQEFFQANIQPVQTKPGILQTLKNNLHPNSPRRYVFALAVVAVIVLVGALFAFNPRPSNATLMVSAGQVTLQTPNHPDQRIVPGQAVNVITGDNLAVQPGAVAQLRFYDGSTVDLSENTRVEMQELVTNDERFRVRMKLLTGRTASRVLRLLGVGDAFEISTPSSTVSVRGTVFTVQVLDNETTYIACEKGVVKVVSGSQQAEVKAGQQLTARADQPLEVKPLSNERPTPGSNSRQGVPPTGVTGPTTNTTNPTNVPTATPMPPATSTTPPTVGAQGTPVPAVTEAIPANGSGATPAAPAATSGSSGPQGTPNSPGQVPGSPPAVVPGSGNPPNGGSEPPGKGGEPPGQTKDKPDKGKSGNK